ncbi:MAG: GNAT family N-acetyltransferase [Spirochaetaceae bacterium]|jgi:predicted acetyltransferase|nr:GNAT family N-acetyltransferase [Spirochaetaceae bacterium]
METVIERIRFEDRELLGDMPQKYQHEIRRESFPAFAVDDAVSIDFPNFDNYWNDSEYVPFFIKADGEIAGFVFVDKYFWVLSKAERHYNVSDIYVREEYRGKGIGKAAMLALLALFKGVWEVKPLCNSKKAETFWERTLKAYSEETFKAYYSGPYKRPIFTLDAG